jgi:LuxR family maltose regulon positive regulatory protein
MSSPEAGPSDTPPILATKLHAPSRAGVMPRPELVRRLAEGPRRRMVLLGAPAGSGKTTLLNEWAENDGSRNFAWLSLDAGDDEPTAFWTYAIEALRRAAPAAGARSLPVLQAPGTDVVRDVLPNLVNELAEDDRPLVLALDDYHAITSTEIHDALAYLADHAPARLQIALSTRADPPLPLPRLRARGELLELRARDLRFGLEEMDVLLNGQLELGLDEHDIGLLHTRTEGWPAGVYLAALSLQHHTDRGAFVAAFAGDDRHLIDYLGAEVLAAQPTELRSFLVRTSVLERLSAPLCDAVLDDHDSAERLEAIERANLFVIPLDDKRRWYRYHHLFGELLRHELERSDPELVPELHRRASLWYSEAGAPSPAIRHALAAGEHDAAAEIIAGSWILELIGVGGDTTVDGWLHALGEEAIANDVRLAVARAYISLSLGRIDEAAAWLDRAEFAPERGPLLDGFPSAEAAISSCRSAYLLLSGDLGGAVAEGRRSERLTEGTPTYAMALGARALAQLWLGDIPDAEETLRRWGELGAAGGAWLFQIHGLGGAALIRVRGDDYETAEMLAREALRISDEHGTEEHWSRAASQLALAQVLASRGDSEAAGTLLARAVELSRRGVGPAATAFALAELAANRRPYDRSAARELLREAGELIAGCDDPGLAAERVATEQRRTLAARPRSGEKLSERELEVLRLLATDKSQREIGGELYVSLNTVKSHVKSLFRKLDASSREQAVERARERALL